TVRAEGHLFPRSTRLAVATLSGDLTGHAFDPALDPGRLVVAAPEHAHDTVRRTLGDVPATLLRIPEHNDPHALIGALRDHGFTTIVCEGGPTLAAQLIDAELV